MRCPTCGSDHEQNRPRCRRGTYRRNTWDSYNSEVEASWNDGIELPPNSTLDRTVPFGFASKERSITVPVAQSAIAGVGIALVTFGVTIFTHADKLPGAMPWWTFGPVAMILTPCVGLVVFLYHNSLLRVKESWNTQEDNDDGGNDSHADQERRVHIEDDRGKGTVADKGLGKDIFDLPDSGRWTAFFRGVLYNDKPFTHRHAGEWHIPRNSSKRKGSIGFVGVRKQLLDLRYLEKDDNGTVGVTPYGQGKLEKIYPPTP